MLAPENLAAVGRGWGGEGGLSLRRREFRREKVG